MPRAKSCCAFGTAEQGAPRDEVAPLHIVWHQAQKPLTFTAYDILLCMDPSRPFLTWYPDELCQRMNGAGVDVKVCRLLLRDGRESAQFRALTEGDEYELQSRVLTDALEELRMFE